MVGWLGDKIADRFNYYAKEFTNEAKLLGKNVERTKLPKDLEGEIQQVEKLYNHCEKIKSLIIVYMKGPISDISSLEASINNLSAGFNSKDNILFQIAQSLIMASKYASNVHSKDYHDTANCLRNLNQHQNDFYDRLPEFLVLLKENQEFKYSMDKIREELSIAMKELDIARASAKQNIDLIAEKARIYDVKLNMLSTVCKTRHTAQSQFILHLKNFLFMMRKYHEDSLRTIDMLSENIFDEEQKDRSHNEQQH